MIPLPFHLGYLHPAGIPILLVVVAVFGYGTWREWREERREKRRGFEVMPRK